jgi:lysyl-tRNA synthetase, class II
MRVAPELYLKMLVVGGMERVFEIGRNFRNEDIDLTHSPEFTSVELYMAWADMYDLLDLTEEMISELVKSITGSYQTVLDKEGTTYNIDWKRPWKRIQMIPALEEATGEKFPPADQLGTDESIAFLERILEKMKIDCAIRTPSKMIDKLAGALIEPSMVNPTFLIGHPQM